MAKVNAASVELQVAAVRSMSQSDLTAQWTNLDDGEIPSLPVSLLRRLVAQRIQERRYGGLPLAVRRELEKLTTSKDVSISSATARAGIGTRFIREWKGQTISVLASDDGTYEWDGRTYRSLSQIAKQVTGTQWSGPKFFGLVKQRSSHG